MSVSAIVPFASSALNTNLTLGGYPRNLSVVESWLAIGSARMLFTVVTK